MINPAILVQSHPNNNEKEILVKDFGNFIKQFNLPTYLFTNFPTSKSSESEYDGSFFHNYNPEVSTGREWYVWNLVPETNLKHTKYIRNWSYSGTHLSHLGFKFLKMMGYTHVLFLSYDSEMDYNKMDKYIKFSLDSFKEKIGVFQEYPIINGNKGISTTAFSCEVNFYINIIGDLLSKYGPNHPITETNPSYLLEHLFEWYLKSYKNDINIIPLNESIKDTYHSAGIPILPDNSEYLTGYFKKSNKVLLTTNTLSPEKFKVTDESNYPLNLELVLDTEKTKIFQFSPKPNSLFNINFENQLIDVILYDDKWKDMVFFEEQ